MTQATSVLLQNAGRAYDIKPTAAEAGAIDAVAEQAERNGAAAALNPKRVNRRAVAETQGVLAQAYTAYNAPLGAQNQPVAARGFGRAQ